MNVVKDSKAYYRRCKNLDFKVFEDFTKKKNYYLLSLFLFCFTLFLVLNITTLQQNRF